MNKNIKFVMTLSITSLIGLQASEAIRVTCPSAKDVKIIEQEDKTFKYEGASTGRSFHFESSPYANKLILDERRLPVAGSIGEISCTYYLAPGYYGLVVLETNDAGAKKCQAPGGTAYFNCPE